jgi:hypothetical protein
VAINKELNMRERLDGGMDLPLIGKRIDSCCFWGADVRLTFDGADGVIFLSSPPFQFSQGTLVRLIDIKELEPKDLVSLVGLVGEFIQNAYVSRSGVLKLEFASTKTMELFPHPDYEGWQVGLNKEGGWMVQSLAGGELFVV